MKLDKKLLIPALSGLQYGYNTSIIAGALLFITTEFSLSPFREGILVASAMIGLCIASFAGILSNSIGRKASLFCGAVCFIAGALLCALTPSYHFLLIGRFLVGLGSGIAVVVAPIYLTEMALPENRGKILNLNQIGIAVGSLIAYSCNYLLSSWRVMFAIALIPALIQFAGLFFIKESQDKKRCSVASWKNVLDPSFRRRFKIILAISLFQALSGSAAVFFFAPRVFENAGFASADSSLLATILIGIVYLCAILFSFLAIDRLGRRPLLIASLSGMALSLLIISFFFWIHSPWANTVTLVCLLTYIAAYSIGMGPVVPPMVIGEISTMQVRGHMMSLMGAIGWTTNYFISITFLPLIGALTLGGTLFIYAIFCLIGLLFSYLVIPETKQKTFEEIETLFKEKSS